jgi:hypothetical protein
MNWTEPVKLSRCSQGCLFCHCRWCQHHSCQTVTVNPAAGLPGNLLTPAVDMLTLLFSCA